MEVGKPQRTEDKKQITCAPEGLFGDKPRDEPETLDGRGAGQVTVKQDEEINGRKMGEGLDDGKVLPFKPSPARSPQTCQPPVTLSLRLRGVGSFGHTRIAKREDLQQNVRFASVAGHSLNLTSARPRLFCCQLTCCTAGRRSKVRPNLEGTKPLCLWGLRHQPPSLAAQRAPRIIILGQSFWRMDQIQ